jgi:poly-gamma-glutamate capsule biosynthesis protein CapA/YwtB (metallophosphatase superfamily)
MTERMTPARAYSFLLCGMLLACREHADAESPRAQAARPAPAVTAAPGPRGPDPAQAELASGVTQAASPLEPRLPDAASAPTPAAPDAEPTIVLAAGGDVNFGRQCGQAILKDVNYDPFADLNAAWSAADLRFINLESQLSDQNGLTQSPRNRLIFSGPPSGADVLARAKVSLVSTANNHAWDYGKGALFETIDNLTRAQVPFAGTGRDVAAAYRPVVVESKGRSIALFAVTHIWNQGTFSNHEGRGYVAWADVDRLKAGIKLARREHDFVIVSYHGGEEYIEAPVDKTRRFVKAVMALGVDAIIGHHPHVPQGVGWVSGRPVFYSLGNFVFDTVSQRPWTRQSFFVRLQLQKGATPVVSACPYALEGHRPRSFASDDPLLGRFRQHLINWSTSVGGSKVATVDELGCLPVAPPK